MNLKPTLHACAAAAVALGASTAMAATGTSDAATSMDGISGAFTDLLSGSGGLLIAVVAVIFAAVVYFIRPSMQVIGGLAVTSALIGYGVDAMTGFGSVTASIPAKLPVLAEAALLIPPTV